MGRLILLAATLSLPFAAMPQDEDRQFRQAGVCGRCHVISVVEWGISAHRQAGAGCTACHGSSEGHVIDERNNVKPERIPHGEALAALCAGCHDGGCPVSRRKAGCRTCHHSHALVDPEKPAVAVDERLNELSARQERYAARMAEAAGRVQAAGWAGARTLFLAALEEKPGDREAASLIRMCERRLEPGLPGFDITGSEFDPATGLPLRVVLAGFGIPMVLVPGGEFELGAEEFPMARPAHTVRVEPFYLAERELTQAEWRAIMGSNPSAHQGGKFPGAQAMPVENVSWEDCRELLAKLDARVAGGGLRLPTEAEWEFAARASDPVPVSGEAEAPRPAGQGRPNRLGLYDMRGNVWEWTSSLARPYPYVAADGREDPSAPGLRILRGGGFADPPEWAHPGFRHAERPARRLRWNGLRLARSVPR
jgi:formylglycine-generating enzyme required for sulfatase activity